LEEFGDGLWCMELGDLVGAVEFVTDIVMPDYFAIR
jgi:hypothetical protein